MLNSENKDIEVVETWQRFVQALLGVLALLGALAMAYYHAPTPVKDADLARQVHQLSRQVEDLERQQSLSMAAVDDARDSVAYIYGIYHVVGKMRGQSFRARVGGTGFVVGPGLLATNRHVAEPWYGDREAALAFAAGRVGGTGKAGGLFPRVAAAGGVAAGGAGEARRPGRVED